MKNVSKVGEILSDWEGAARRTGGELCGNKPLYSFFLNRQHFGGLLQLADKKKERKRKMEIRNQNKAICLNEPAQTRGGGVLGGGVCILHLGNLILYSLSILLQPKGKMTVLDS